MGTHKKSVTFIVLALDWNLNISPCPSKIAINQVKINLQRWFNPILESWDQMLSERKWAEGLRVA